MKYKKFLITLSVILLTGAIVFGVWRSRAKADRPAPGVPGAALAQQSDRGRPRARNLSLQPEAFNMARRLGSRFEPSKRDTSVTVGRLIVGSDQRQVQTRRVQTDQGEEVEVKLSGSNSTLTWDAANGSLSSGRQASGNDRDLLERLVFDSPDQFVLGQLRGASYFTIARNVRPANVGDNYQGPLWTVVRVSTPEQDVARRPESLWRLYYINTSTGLIDRIESEVNGQRLHAEFSDWTNKGGEQVPGRVVWTSEGRTLMEYQLVNFSHGNNER